MITYQITCTRCGETWSEDIDTFNSRRDPYHISRFVGTPGAKTGMYQSVQLCSRCMSEFEKFMNRQNRPKYRYVADSCIMDGYFVAYRELPDGTDGCPELITTEDINSYKALGCKVVTLESYLEAKKGERK